MYVAKSMWLLLPLFLSTAEAAMGPFLHDRSCHDLFRKSKALDTACVGEWTCLH